MLILLVSFFVALVATLWVIHSAKRHAHLSHDHDLSGPQKFHATPVPRIGGVGLLAGVVGGLGVVALHDKGSSLFMLKLLACAMPAFLAGLAEDLTKNVSPRRRLIFTAISAVMAYFVVEAQIHRFGPDSVERMLGIGAVALPVTVFAVVGVTNAVNIIDGFNGLASMCCVMMLLAVAYVAQQCGDVTLFWIALAFVGAVAGFFIWNFPAGMIFLGDGGAYLLGFVVAELSVLLVERNQQVSPVFPLLVCIYPIFETLFSIYRKKFLRNMSPGVPDGVHLHMLIYKRLMRWAVGSRDAKELTRRNSLTSPYLWVMCMSAVAPALLYWDDTVVMSVLIGCFAVAYVALYWSIVRFRAPRWLVLSRKR